MLTAKQCGDRAAACELLAGQCKDPVIEKSYRSLVKTWRGYAETLEARDRNEWQSIVRSIESPDSL